MVSLFWGFQRWTAPSGKQLKLYGVRWLVTCLKTLNRSVCLRATEGEIVANYETKGRRGWGSNAKNTRASQKRLPATQKVGLLLETTKKLSDTTSHSSHPLDGCHQKREDKYWQGCGNVKWNSLWETTVVVAKKLNRVSEWPSTSTPRCLLKVISDICPQQNCTQCLQRH